MPTNPVNLESNDNIEVGSWRGHPQFKCRHCAFDSLEREITEDHVFTRHLMPGMQPAERPLEALLFDEGGNKIVTIPVSLDLSKSAATPPPLPVELDSIDHVEESQEEPQRFPHVDE